jgi:hypothetical protein
MALKAQYSIVLQSKCRPNDISQCSVLKCDGTSTCLFSYVFVYFSLRSLFFSFLFSFIFSFSLPVSFVPLFSLFPFLNLFLCFIPPVLSYFPSLILYLFPSFIPLSFQSLLCLLQSTFLDLENFSTIGQSRTTVRSDSHCALRSVGSSKICSIS